MNETTHKPLLIEAFGVQKSFGGVPALKNGVLNLRAGEVHALCGGNGAGKSTFLNILMGILQKDAGTIRLQGKAVAFQTPKEALNAGISIITQELSPIHGMTVAENIFLGHEPRLIKGMVDFRTLFAKTGAFLEKLKFDIDPKAPMHRLSLAQMQMVEIAKALSHQSRIIIMDEPTSAIGEQETEILFDAISSVLKQGAGIIYVSHRLSEIFTIAHRYTVFRDGQFVEEGKIADIDRRHLVRQIVGRELKSLEDKPDTQNGVCVLATQNLSREGEFEDISLKVHQGEILGIYGLVGSGRSEFLNCVFGLTQKDSGQVHLLGKPLSSGNTKEAIQRGLALVTEDRKASGLVLTSSVAFNISLSALPRLSYGGYVHKKNEKTLIERMIDRMRVKLASPAMLVSGLSGGNQQKVVLARCLATAPICLLCDEPTRGIDEGAKREVYAFLSDFVKNGGAAMVISSEAPEILEVSHKIAIFKKGKLFQVINAKDANQEALLHLAS